MVKKHSKGLPVAMLRDSENKLTQVGSILGTLWGALVIAVLNNGLTLLGVSFFWQLVAKGAVIVAAVGLDRFRRGGADNLDQHRRRRGQAAHGVDDLAVDVIDHQPRPRAWECPCP